jgi:hypothetical protein
MTTPVSIVRPLVGWFFLIAVLAVALTPLQEHAIRLVR